jgi:alpha-mannosidase
MESGRIRQSLRVVFDLGMTRVIQDITLHVHSRRVDLFNTIDWHMRRTMLRADLPLNVLTRVARYDLSCGYIERPTTVNNYFQEAAFEVPAHRWVDLSEYGYGVSVLNNGKYGHGVRGSTVSLNLLRSPIFPDFFADEGRHEFVYSIYPHGGSDLLGTLREAENINRDLLAIEGRFKIERPFIEIDAPTIGVMALKLAEEGSGKVLRVAELLGARGRVRIRTAFKFARAWLCNLLEERIEPLATDGENVALDYEPFGIYTVMFEG